MTDNYGFTYTDYLQMSFEMEALQAFESQPFSPIASNEAVADLFIPKRSPQLLSVEELGHEQSIQSVSEQEPHTIPAIIDYSALMAEFQKYWELSSPTYPAPRSSPSSPSSSSPLSETERIMLDMLKSMRTLEKIEREKRILNSAMQAPVAFPGEYPTDNNFGPLPYFWASSPSAFSPLHCPPSLSSPSSASPTASCPSGSPDNNFSQFSYLFSSSSSGSPPASSSFPPSSSPSAGSYTSSTSGSPPASAFTPQPQTAQYTSSLPFSSGTMNPADMFIHPVTMHGPSFNTHQPIHNFAPHTAPSYPMNVGYGYTSAPAASMPHTQTPMGGNVENYNNRNYNYGGNTIMNTGVYSTGYYPQDPRAVAANVGQHYPVPAPPPYPMHQQSHFIAPERNEFKDYNYAQTRNLGQRRLRQLRPPSSDMPSTANHHAGPSSSSFATTQHNYVGYDMPPQSQGPHLHQPGPRSDRFQPYERPRTDDRGRRTQVQPLPSPKCRGLHTQHQTTHGSVLHHGETEPRKNHRFDRRDRAGSNSCSKESFVEQGYPRTSQPSQSRHETQEVTPRRCPSKPSNTSELEWRAENMIVTPPAREEVEQEQKLTDVRRPNCTGRREKKKKTGAVMRNERAGDNFVTVSGRVIPDEEQQ